MTLDFNKYGSSVYFRIYRRFYFLANNDNDMMVNVDEIDDFLLDWKNCRMERNVSTEWMEADARKRMEEIRTLPVETNQQFLVPPTDDWSWKKTCSIIKSL